VTFAHVRITELTAEVAGAETLGFAINHLTGALIATDGFTAVFWCLVD
jgi:hypothetical protein